MLVFLLACISKKPINLYSFEADSKHMFVEVDIRPISENTLQQDTNTTGYNSQTYQGPYFFMVDTGATTSIINQRMSRSLGLQLQMKDQPLVGLGGIHTYYSTRAKISFEGNEQEIQFAVGVQGLPEQIKGVPIAGILGNDFFENYIVELDYQRHHLKLHSHDDFDWNNTKEKPMPISYRYGAIHVDVEIKEDNDNAVKLDAIVDTGAQYVLLRDSDIPQNFTRIPRQKYLLGLGSNNPFWVQESLSYRSLQLGEHSPYSYDESQSAYIIPQDREAYMPQNIIGGEVFSNKVLTIDYKNQQMQVRESTSKNVKPKDYDISEEMLRRIEKNSDDYNLETKLQILVASRKLQKALDEISKYEQLHSKEGTSSRITNFKLQILMLSQRYEDVAQVYLGLKEQDICKLTDLRSVLYSLFVSQNHDALFSQLKSESISCINENLKLKSDMYLLLGSYEQAFELLLQDGNSSSDQILIRKALLSHLMGKDLESIAYLRNTLQNERMLHSSLFLYIDAFHDSKYKDILVSDLSNFGTEAIALDMQTLGWKKLNKEQKSLNYMTLGLQKDCKQLQTEQLQNCNAWYEILAGQNINGHYRIMKQLVEENPFEASYLDTYAMILQQLDRSEEAKKHWILAMILSPNSEYMLYQYLRTTL